MMMASRVLADGVDPDLAAHHDRAAAEVIGRADALAPEDDAAGREIRSRNDVDQLVDAQRRIVDQRHAGIDHLAEIVRRNIGRHADGDAAGAVDQQVRKLRRQNRRLAIAVVVVGLEIDGILVNVVEQRLRDLGEPGFGVTHRRRHIAVHRAEIALAVDQRHPHGEILRHANQRIVDRLIAVRMVFTDDVADGARRLVIRLVPFEPVLIHRVENAPMHRLEPVARIGQRARHDHAHGVIEVGAFHLVEDGDGTNIGRPRRLSGLGIFGVRQRGNPVSFRSESYSVSRASKPPLTGWRHRFFPSFFQRLTGSVAAFAATGEPYPWKLFSEPLSTRRKPPAGTTPRRVAIG